jgi:hypothetical protein
MGGGGHWHGRRPTSVSEDGDGVLDGGTTVTGPGRPRLARIWPGRGPCARR